VTPVTFHAQIAVGKKLAVSLFPRNKNRTDSRSVPGAFDQGLSIAEKSATKQGRAEGLKPWIFATVS
jgi:hypothetical protein